MLEPSTYDHYFDYAELTRHLQALQARRPDLVNLHSIGTSYEGRNIWCATVTNTATGPAEEKPAVWIDGNIHATEVSACSAAIYFIDLITSEHGSDPEITRCLDTRTFYVVPRVNPDGAEAMFAEKPKFLRSSVRPYPYDEEPLEGLERQDVDGDGRLLNMRIPDPHGPWKAHPDEPRLLIRRDPTETGGTYYRLLPEGLIENWDGVTLRMRPNKEGLDLNRNFPAHWRQEVEQHGAGPYPTSEPEVRAIVQYIASHPNITAGVTFHTYSGVLLRPYGTQSDENFPAEDLWTYQKIGEKGTALTGYPAISVFHDFKYHPKEVITGVFDDWLYDHLGIFGWTVEIWSAQRMAGIKCFGPEKPEGGYKFIDWYREHPVEDDLALLKWADEHLPGEGYVNWYPYEHPQLGPIEIGGWNPFLMFRNPPPALLRDEIARFPKWLTWHALISPKLEIHSLDLHPLGNGVYKLRLVVENTGWLPTYVTKKALERKTTRGVIAEITLPEGAELLTGKTREDLGQLEGRAYDAPAPSAWSADTTDERAKFEWTVRGRAGSTLALTVRHERAGTLRRDVVLT